MPQFKMPDVQQWQQNWIQLNNCDRSVVEFLFLFMHWQLCAAHNINKNSTQQHSSIWCVIFFSATIAMTAAAWRLRARARTSEQANVLYCCIKINENSEGKLASRLNVCKCEPCANIAAYQISDNWCVNNRRRTK